MAVHADDLFDSARRTDSLAAAIGECGLAVGTTRRRGRKRKAFSLSVQEFAAMAWARPGRTAIVFGNERTGLSGPELEACHMAIHIPTAPEFPSLNLAQAVMVLCWELARNRPGGPSSGVEPVGSAALASGAEEIVQGLERMGYFRLRGQDEHRALLRDLLARAAPSPSEFAAFKAMFRKCEGLWKAASGGGE
jgi:TrmH family RNA methyltransferase